MGAHDADLAEDRVAGRPGNDREQVRRRIGDEVAQRTPVAMSAAISGAPSGTGRDSSAGPIAASQPTAMTQPRTEIGPIIRLEREDASVAIAHDRAAQRPPRIATIERGV